MSERIHNSASDAVEELVIECLERIESDGDAALEAVCAMHPQHAESLRVRMGALKAAGLLDAAKVGDQAAFPERLGDFRLIERLGGGGMGVVYLARQESLSREVALKLIRPEHLYFPGARERFRREVETVARLAHPGIVPIYTVGEERGIPFFAMERVEGCTLADVIDYVRPQVASKLDGADFDSAIAASMGGAAKSSERGRDLAPIFQGTWVQACLRIVREAAEALEHVHRRGVRHRDMKPSNVMLTRSGRVMLLDFGLSSAEGVDRMTKTGSQLGSLPYMSPEQVRGDASMFEARSDVYSLGATLYELLTLRMPFAEEKTSDLRRKIIEGRPPSIRELNGSVGWDVETVCLHAMENDPSRRYASAADFAHDLTNVLEHRPITARRASATLRTRRWVQRHPAFAVGLVLGAALVVGGPSVYAWQQHEANVAIAAKNTEIETQSLALSKSLDSERELRSESDAQRARAERNFSAAFEAVSTMLRQVGAKDLANTPEMDDTRRQLLERALDFFHRFVRDEGSNRALRVEVARTQRSIADVCFDLGRIEESELAFKAAIDGMRALRAEQPGQLAHVAALSNTLIGYGRFLSDEGRLAEAIEAQDEAIELARLVLANDPANVDKRVDLAYALSWRGLTGTNAGRRDDGERDLDESLSLTRNPDGTTHEDAGLRQIEGRALITLGLSHYYDKQLEEADASVRRALAIREEAWKAAPTDRTSRMELSEALADLALVHWGDQDPAEAENAMRRAIELQEALIRDFPRVTLYRQQVTTLYGNLGALVEQRHHDSVEGERLLARAVDVLQPLLDERPNAPDYQFEMGAALSSLAAVQRDQGRLEEACATIERGLACERTAHSISEAKIDYLVHLRSDSIVAADTYIARGMHAKAAEHARNAREYGAGDWTTLGLAATRLAKCVELADGDTSLGDDERATLIEHYTNESLDTLRTALDAPGFDWGQLGRSHYLDSVRANPRFDEIDELAKSRDP